MVLQNENGECQVAHSDVVLQGSLFQESSVSLLGSNRNEGNEMSDDPGQDLDGVGTTEVSLGNLMGRGLIAEPEKLVAEDRIPEPFLLAEDGSNFLHWRRKH